jgi:hypothetical protein
MSVTGRVNSYTLTFMDNSNGIYLNVTTQSLLIFFLMALQPQFWALAYLHETLCFTSVF